MNAVQIFKPSTISATEMPFLVKLSSDLSSVALNGPWSDIVVTVRGKSFECHKIILAARSSFFETKLTSDGDLTEFVEHEGNGEAFAFIRRYIYAGVIDQDPKDVKLIADVLCLSIKYKLDELTSFMSDRMRDRISIDNAVKVFHLMANIKLHSIVENCLKMIGANVDDCLKTNDFNDLNMTNLVQLFGTIKVSDGTKYGLISKWFKKHPGIDAAKLFAMLDGDIELPENMEKEEEHGKQYILMKGCDGVIIILDADTLEEILTRTEPTTIESQIVVFSKIFYVINPAMGEIICAPVSSLLRSQRILWEKCTNFPPSSVCPTGNATVCGNVIYFVNKSQLCAFDTFSNTVTPFRDNFVAEHDNFYSMVDVHGVTYCYGDNNLMFTDGTSGWSAIDIPSLLIEKHQYATSLIGIRDKIYLVGGEDKSSRSVFSCVFCYNTKSKSWTKINSMNQGRSASATVQLGGQRIGAFGGWNGEKWLDTSEVFDEQSQRWLPIPYQKKLVWPQAVTFYA